MAEQSERIGQQVGDYRLSRYLGGGNFGGVYLGAHTRTGGQAAIKVLRTRLSTPDEIKGFLNEARTMRLRHPHIVSILDFGIDDDETPYLVMEYAPNGTLRMRHPKDSRVPLATIVSYTSQLASALQYAHDMQIVHRDVKPENMLLGARNEVLLSDFGIASVAHNTRSLVTQDSFGGTVAYMAPEQSSGRPRPASDQYALAICVYEWLTGVRPFQGTVMEVAVQHRLNPPSSLRDRVPTISPAVERVVLKALEKDPRQRFPSVQEFARVLEEASQQAFPAVSAPACTPNPVTPQFSMPGFPGPALPAAEQREPVARAQSSWHVPETPAIQNTAYISHAPQSSTFEGISQDARLHRAEPQPPFSSSPGTTLSETSRTPLRRSTGLVVTLIALVILLIASTTSIAYLVLPNFLHNGQNTPTPTIPTATVPQTNGDYETAIARNGSMFGFDSQHTHENSYEHTINTNNAENLKNSWRFGAGNAIGSAPVVANGSVYFGNGDGRLFAVDVTTGKQKWTYATNGPILSSPAIANGVVYIGSNDKTLYAINAETGKPVWTFPTEAVINSSPVVVDGVVYIGSYDGHLYALDAVTGKQKWAFAVDSAVYASPAVADGVIYAATSRGKLYAIDLANTHKKWEIELGDSIYSSPAVVDGVVYVGSGDHSVYATATGTKKWAFPTGKEVKSSPAVAAGIVYVGSNDGSLYALDAVTGQKKWEYTTGNAINSSPMVANGVVYVGSTDHSLYAFDAATGKKLWSFTTDGAIYSSPAVANGVVYVGSDDGALYSFAL